MAHEERAACCSCRTLGVMCPTSLLRPGCKSLADLPAALAVAVAVGLSSDNAYRSLFRLLLTPHVKEPTYASPFSPFLASRSSRQNCGSKNCKYTFSARFSCRGCPRAEINTFFFPHKLCFSGPASTIPELGRGGGKLKSRKRWPCSCKAR